LDAGDDANGPAGRTLLLDAIDALIERPDDPDQRRRTTELLRKYWAAILGRDADALRGLYSHDVLVELPFSESGRVEEGHFRTFRGIEDVMAFWATAFSFEGGDAGLYDAEVNMTGDGRVVFVEGFGRVTMASGHDYRNRYVFRMTVDRDVVTSFREYYNPIVAARAFGRPIVAAE